MMPVAPESPAGERPELLDLMFARQSRSANASQRHSVQQWQAKGQYYERVQRAVEGERDELLFQPGVVLRIVAVDASWDVPIIEAEVSRS